MDGLIQFGYWPPGKPWRWLPLHTNPGLEIVLITKGEFTWEVDGRRESIVPGTVFFTLPGQRHGAGERKHPGVELHFIVLDLHRLGLPRADQRWAESTLRRAQRHALPATPLLRTLVPAIVRELAGSASGQEALATGLLRAAVVELARTVMANPGTRPARADASAAVRRFTQELQRRLAEVWTLEAMAQACGLKRTQFAARFAELTGDTPMTYLNRIRVRYAEELLAKSGKTVTEVAFACGFQSSQYFATVFRQFTGERPSARRLARK